MQTILSMQSSLTGRINRLPSPTSHRSALLPIFEAISNSIQSIRESFGDNAPQNGKIIVSINTLTSPFTCQITDNGFGMNKKNFNAFRTMDTPNKIKIGGKGMGRLLWLSAFKNISITSVYKDTSFYGKRKFNFLLSDEGQITDYEDKKIYSADMFNSIRTVVEFSELTEIYKEKIPKKSEIIIRTFVSHFLPSLIGKKTPKIHFDINNDITEYPDAVSQFIIRQEDIKVHNEKYGELKIVLLECNRNLTINSNEKNFIHFIAHDRTVESIPIDKKLGFGLFTNGTKDKLCFQACVFGEYLDKHVNQERTSFTFEKQQLECITNELCMPGITTFLENPLQQHQAKQYKEISDLVIAYPSIAFTKVEELQTKIPLGETQPDAIFGQLSRERYRRDKKQGEKLKKIFSNLRGKNLTKEIFDEAIKIARDEIEPESERSLTEYVIRRKAVLEMLEALLEATNTNMKDTSYQREEIVHSLLCPTKIQTREKGNLSESASSHELWVIDERLTFAQYISSDIPFKKILENSSNKLRPDLMIFDRAFSLADSPLNPSRIMIIELKRPGRTDYGPGEDPKLQIMKYIQALQGQQIRDFKGRICSIKKDCIFDCYIVADCLSKEMELWTADWAFTPDGKGKIHVFPSNGSLRGSITLIGWNIVIDDAKERNKIFFERAGISQPILFPE